MTAIYVAWGASPVAARAMLAWDWKHQPLSVLVSFYYLKQWLKLPHGEALCVPNCPTLMLDSGAYSAWNAGKVIDIQALIEESKNPRWTETIALDVIDDGPASLANCRIMKAAGSDAYPVFHFGEPFELLKEYCDTYPKVGLSCRFGETPTESIRFYSQCFARQWPHRFHSFGWIQKSVLKRFPFHSADATTWSNAVLYGQYRMCKQMVSLKNITSRTADVRSGLEYFWLLQQELKSRWQKELASI